MPLPQFDSSLVIQSLSNVSLEPIYENLFETRADLPDHFLENITGYDLDVENKRVTFTVQLYEDFLIDPILFSARDIKILHPDKKGKVFISTELGNITNPIFCLH